MRIEAGGLQKGRGWHSACEEGGGCEDGAFAGFSGGKGALVSVSGGGCGQALSSDGAWGMVWAA